jgi:hypothetical protein
LVAFLDDDDVWHPDKLRAQVESLGRTPGAVGVTCGIVIRAGRRAFVRLPAGAVVTRDDLIAGRHAEIHPSTIVAPLARFTCDVGLVDEDLPGSYGEDYDWLLRLTALGPVVAVQRPLVTVHWERSHFADRWATIARAIPALLEKHPELMAHPGNRARLLGRIAFALAASGERGAARRWAEMSIRSDPRQLRGYLALLVAAGLPPGPIHRMARMVGRGV